MEEVCFHGGTARESLQISPDYKEIFTIPFRRHGDQTASEPIRDLDFKEISTPRQDD
jgi:hypothetical protein